MRYAEDRQVIHNLIFPPVFYLSPIHPNNLPGSRKYPWSRLASMCRYKGIGEKLQECGEHIERHVRERSGNYWREMHPDPLSVAVPTGEAETLIARTLVESDAVPPEPVSCKIQNHSDGRSEVHIDGRVIRHVFLAQQVLRREIVDKGKGNDIDHAKLNGFMEDADRISCKLPHIPVKKFFQAVCFEQIDIQGCKEQKDCALDQNAAYDCPDIVKDVADIPDNAGVSRRDDKQYDPQPPVSDGGKPIRIGKDKLEKEAPRP